MNRQSGAKNKEKAIQSDALRPARNFHSIPAFHQ
jgi:hypothetical protein